MLQGLNFKTYRFETIVIEEVNPKYYIEKKYVRNVEIYILETNNNVTTFQLLVIEFQFSDDDNALGKLIKQISYLFDELIIDVDDNGKIIKLRNIHFLQLRWLKIKSKLSLSHKGDVVEDYFKQIDELLYNEDKLIFFLEDYNMFGLLFHGLWNNFEGKIKRLLKNNVTEIISIKKNKEKIIQEIFAESLDDTDFLIYRGFCEYKNDNYEEGFIETKTHKNHLKYSLLWVN